MKLIKEQINNAIREYKLYRSYVPSYASAALSFYIIMMIVPALTLIAIVVSTFNFDLSIFKDYLNEIIFPNYTNTIINILESRTLSSVAIVTTVISFWVVSRGVSMVYQISNVMFHNKKESFIPFMIHSFEMTFFILVLTIGLIGINVIGPIGELIVFLKSISRFKYLLMLGGLEVIFFLLYVIISRCKDVLIPAFIGANLSTVCFVCVHRFLSIYYTYANFKSVYGPFSAIIMVLFAIRIYAEVFYIGLYVICRMRDWRDHNGKTRN